MQYGITPCLARNYEFLENGFKYQGNDFRRTIEINGKNGKRISFRETLSSAGKFNDYESNGIRGLSARTRLRLQKRFLRRLRDHLPYQRSARTQKLPCLSATSRGGDVRSHVAFLPACQASIRYQSNQAHATDYDAAVPRNLFVYRL